jgi:hypothetical protein
MCVVCCVPQLSWTYGGMSVPLIGRAEAGAAVAEQEDNKSERLATPASPASHASSASSASPAPFHAQPLYGPLAQPAQKPLPIMAARAATTSINAVAIGLSQNEQPVRRNSYRASRTTLPLRSPAAEVEEGAEEEVELDTQLLLVPSSSRTV